MNIITTYIRPPVNTTAFDWMAYSDDGEGDGLFGLTGYGATECEALRSLAEQMALALLEKSEKVNA